MRVTFVGGPLDKQVLAVPDGRTTWECAQRLSDRFSLTDDSMSCTDIRRVPYARRVVYSITKLGDGWMGHVADRPIASALALLLNAYPTR